MEANNKSVLKNVVWMIFEKVFILALGFFITLKIANYYGTLAYGTYQYAMNVVALFEIIINYADARVIKKRFVSEDSDELVWNATVLRLLFSFFAFAGGIAYFFICRETIELKLIFLILLINTIITDLRFGMQIRYEYLLQAKKIILAGNISSLVGATLQYVAVINNMPIITIALIGVVTSLLNLLILYLQYRHQFGSLKKGHIRSDIIREVIWESLPLTIGGACTIIYTRCDSIMIGNLLSKSDVGIYAIANGLISVTIMGIDPIRESFFPKLVELYSKDKKQYSRYYIQITAILSWISIIGILFSFVVLPFVFKLLRKEYSMAFPVFQIYTISVFFMYNAGLRAGHFTLKKRGNILMVSQIVSVIVNFVLNLFLINKIGIRGAALATGITQGISLELINLFWGKDGMEVLFWQLKGLNPYYIIKKFSKKDG